MTEHCGVLQSIEHDEVTKPWQRVSHRGAWHTGSHVSSHLGLVHCQVHCGVQRPPTPLKPEATCELALGAVLAIALLSSLICIGSVARPAPAKPETMFELALEAVLVMTLLSSTIGCCKSEMIGNVLSDEDASEERPATGNVEWEWEWDVAPRAFFTADWVNTLIGNSCWAACSNSGAFVPRSGPSCTRNVLSLSFLVAAVRDSAEEWISLMLLPLGSANRLSSESSFSASSSFRLA